MWQYNAECIDRCCFVCVFVYVVDLYLGHVTIAMHPCVANVHACHWQTTKANGNPENTQTHRLTSKRARVQRRTIDHPKHAHTDRSNLCRQSWFGKKPNQNHTPSLLLSRIEAQMLHCTREWTRWARCTEVKKQQSMAKFLFLLVSPMFVCAAARMCNGLFGVSNHANPLFSFRFHFFFSLLLITAGCPCISMRWWRISWIILPDLDW